MEKICEHCNEQFNVKRKDVVYCSASCRQMAYMDRKFNFSPNMLHGTIQAIPLSDDIDNEPSVDTLQQKNETSIDGLENYTETSIDVSQQNEEPSIDTLKHNLIKTETNITAHETTEELIAKLSLKEYKPIASMFSKRIADISNSREYISTLNTLLFVHKDVPSYEVGKRLKCLIECLLLFSEMSQTDMDDLKEVCNAFTQTIGSKYYKNLSDKYPYKVYAVSLRDKLKQLIIENRQDKEIQFRLNTGNKAELIAVRFELSHFYTKTKFCDLNFSE